MQMKELNLNFFEKRFED